MNRSDLVAAAAKNAGMTQKAMNTALDGMFEAIGEELRAGGKVVVPGWISCSTAIKPAREAVNPKTGEKVSVAEKNVVKLKAGIRFLGKNAV